MARESEVRGACASVLTQFADLTARLDLEARIRDGARNMLQLLDARDAGNDALRSQIQRELYVAESHLEMLSTQRASLWDASEARVPAPAAAAPFLRPRAIRAVQGLDDLNAASAHDSWPLDDAHHAADAIVRVLLEGLAQRPGVPTTAPAVLYAFLSTLLSRVPALRTHMAAVPLIRCALQGAGAGTTESVRGYAFRCLRYALHDTGLPALAAHAEAVSLIVGRALVREESHAFEREQALKLVRVLIECMRDGNTHARALVSGSIVRALVAIVQETDDALHDASVETLVEIAVVDPPRIAGASGFAPIWRAVSEARAEQAAPLVQALLGLLDQPKTRRHICPGTDLESVMVGFTDAARASEQRCATTRCVMTLLLRSWHGLFYLCMRERGALRALVATLRAGGGAVDQALGALLDVLGEDETQPYLAYRGLLTELLLDAGALDVLVELVQNAPEQREAATRLLARLLATVEHVRPRASAALHTFPSLVRLAVDLPSDTPQAQLAGKTALTAIDQVERAPSLPRARCDDPPPVSDDVLFRAQLRDSNVTLSREHSAWSVPLIFELLDGSLWDARRFDEALNGTKFVKRLLSFFRPWSLRYSAMRHTEQNDGWTRVGVLLLRVLLHHPDGVRLLAEDRLLPELRDALAQVEHGASDTLLGAASLRSSLAGGYVEFLQELAAAPAGAELLAHARLFTALLALCAASGGDATALAIALLERWDAAAARGGSPRAVLTRALVAGPEPVRIAASRCTARLLWHDGAPQPWAMRLLLAQQHDVALGVRTLATHLLHTACEHPAMARCAMAQGLPLIGADSVPLLLRCVAEPHGFAALARSGAVARAVAAWRAHEASDYVARADAALAERAPLPPHLYGGLAETRDGAAYLQSLGVVDECVAILRGVATEATADATPLLAAAWAVGHVGTAEHGLALLADAGVAALTTVATTAESVRVRAVGFYACALVASTSQGRAALVAHGWGTPDARVCIPRDLHAFVTLSAPSPPPPDAAPRLVPPTDALEAHAAALLANLGNAIVAAPARRTLAKLRAEHPALFASTPLLGRALHLLDYFSFRLGARRAVWELIGTDVPLTLETIAELQRWRAECVAEAPVAPVRRALDVHGSLRSKPGAQLLYAVPPRQPATRRNAQENVSTPAGVAPREDTGSRPHTRPLGSTSRSAWPLRIGGFPTQDTPV